ncbi:lipocalin-like domain-containing protein [Prevotella sp. E13-27]|uniref:lipocalin-like domain-containing protein n=1 Tax=Prevotella sp. E13-27 TaxID=2938122 RepID=UPI00200A9522|nr:lipocalin-like domain-containing protein [Prevotella sp. E13-27]MCK8622849.1 lipocalin-like domain-containing protein [Prevotella sp. E13-27]
MKKIIYMLFAMVLMTSCDLETSDNGDLDGFWQLAQLDSLTTSGDVKSTTDMRHSGWYWCVQHKLLEIRDCNDASHNIFFRFEKTSNTLRLYSPISDNRAISDSIVSNPNTLKPLGIQSLDETMTIEQMTSEKMVLNNRVLRFHLRKY